MCDGPPDRATPLRYTPYFFVGFSRTTDNRGRTSGANCTICNNRNAAPDGFRRPVSQLMAVSRDTFNHRANTP